MKPYELLQRHKLIAILRGIPERQAAAAADALEAGGIRLIEVTMNTPGALDVIASWKQRASRSFSVGAGTVVDLKAAKEAVAAGAEFLISPNLDEHVMTYALEQGVEIWPGVMTPTEIMRAWKLGARAVKLFPFASLGIGYLKEIRAPLNHIPIIATGGVYLGNIGEVLEAGAIGVGLGSRLVDKSAIAEGRFGDLENTARQFVEAVEAYRAAHGEA